MRARILAFAIACATAGTAARARASPSAKLTYLRDAGAESCPDEAELRKAVAARLGYDLFFPWARTTVVAEISRAHKGFHGRVHVVDDHALTRGERSIDSASDDCADVVRALALTISIAVDDFGLDDVPAPQPSPASGEPSPVDAPSDSPSEEPPPSPPRRELPTESVRRRAAHPPARIAFAAWLAPIASFGVAPATAVGGQADLEIRHGAASLGLEARGDLPAAKGTSVGGSVSTHLFAGSLAPCVRYLSPVFFCGLLSLGEFRASGVGIAVPHSDGAFFAAAGARVGAEIPLGAPFFFVAHVDGLATLIRHAVQIDGQTVFTPLPITASLGIGAGAHF